MHRRFYGYIAFRFTLVPGKFQTTVTNNMSRNDENAAGQAPRPHVTICRNGRKISLDGDVEPVLSSGRTLKSVARSDANHGYFVDREMDSLLRPINGMSSPNAGLFPALQCYAAHRGCDVDYFDESVILPLPNPAADRRIIDTQLPPFLRSHDSGLIRICRNVGVAEIVAQIVAANPQCRIAVLGTHRAQLDAVADKLTNWLRGHQVRRTVPADDSGAWVGLSTFTMAADGDLEKCHVVIVLDATHALHQHAEAALSTMDGRFRLFGLLRADRRLSPTERDRLMAIFGPAVLDIPQHGMEMAAVNVAWLDVHGPRLDRGTDQELLFRRGFWQHPSRNRIIARLARELRDGNHAPLARYREIARWIHDHPQRPSRITVLVDNVEHAISLGEQLPNWPIIAGENNSASLNTHGLAERKRRLLHERRSMWITGEQQIVTLPAAPSLRLASTDVIVWAGGGAHRPNIPRSWLLHPAGTNHKLLIVDVMDRHHTLLSTWSHRRHEQYIAAEQFDVGVSAELGRVAWFSCQPPRRTQCMRALQR